jgi:predicted RNA binding protein YcfA (HicA-like mRNA interferase family)
MSVKKLKLVKYLESHNCHLHRNGSKHDIFKNNLTGKKTTVPRHPQLDKFLCDLICKQLEIPKMGE